MGRVLLDLQPDLLCPPLLHPRRLHHCLLWCKTTVIEAFFLMFFNSSNTPVPVFQNFHWTFDFIRFNVNLPTSTWDMFPSGWSPGFGPAFAGGSYPMTKFMVALGKTWFQLTRACSIPNYILMSRPTRYHPLP